MVGISTIFDDDQIAAVFTKVKEEHGHLDILVNNVFKITQTRRHGRVAILGTPRQHLGRPSRNRTPRTLCGLVACSTTSLRITWETAHHHQHHLTRRPRLPIQLVI